MTNDTCSVIYSHDISDEYSGKRHFGCKQLQNARDVRRIMKEDARLDRERASFKRFMDAVDNYGFVYAAVYYNDC